MQIKELGEIALIKAITEQFTSVHPRIIKGIGDDASVTIQNESTYLLCTTDTLVEDIHFSLKYTPPYNLGKKAVSVSLSDIAAMGGTPLFLITSIILPANTSTDFINLVYKGIKHSAEEFDVKLIGGNTSSSPDKIIVSTTMLGEVAKNNVAFRKGASVGDNIYVTGCLGDSALGLKILKESQKLKKTKGKEIIANKIFNDAILKHIDPAPRVKEGMEIARRKLASSMIDISDGLILDLKHITEESMVGAKVWQSKIPISLALKTWISDNPQDITLAVNGGEDYELLFTASKENSREINVLSKDLGIQITQIGEIETKEDGVIVLDERGGGFQLVSEGFEHFKGR